MPVTLLLHLAPYVAMAVMGLGIWGLWNMHEKDALKHESDQAVIQQNLKDHANSEKQIGILQTKLEGIDAKVQPRVQYVTAAPVTTGCGPTVGYVIDGVRDDRSGGKVSAGSKPAKPGPLPVPLHTAGKTN